MIDDKGGMRGFEKVNKLLVDLISAALGSQRKCSCSNSAVEWREVFELSTLQGVSAVAFDGLSVLLSSSNSAISIPLDVKLRWIGQVSFQEQVYTRNWDVACALAELWKTVGIEPIVLKGRSIASFYAMPEHRYSCDWDVFIPSPKWERASELLEKKGITLVRDVYKEVEFTYNGVYVECHRCITPYRGNKVLKRFEQYLRQLLVSSKKLYFEGTSLVCPPLMFTAMLFIEHALGDLLHGKLSLKHVVDWSYIRKQEIDKEEIGRVCDSFGFSRFLHLIDALADVIEGAKDYESLSAEYKDVFDAFFVMPRAKTTIARKPKSLIERRIELFFGIIRNEKMYRRFGYCSMERFLWGSIWTHFFDKRVEEV